MTPAMRNWVKRNSTVVLGVSAIDIDDHGEMTTMTMMTTTIMDTQQRNMMTMMTTDHGPR